MQPTRVLQVFSLGKPTDDIDPADPTRKNREDMLAMLNDAARFDPDFVSFPELQLAAGIRNELSAAAVAEPVPGPATEAFGEAAADLDCYVWLPMYERDGDDLYNSVVLLGPDGDVQGTYRKIAPTDGEINDRGITPGDSIPTWETEFGRVGATICWDVRYDEIALSFRAQETDLVFMPSVGAGTEKLRHWAKYHGFHIVFTQGAYTKIFTPRGNVKGSVGVHRTAPEVTDIDFHGTDTAKFSFDTINTDCRSYAQADMGNSQLDEVQRTYGGSLAIHTDLRQDVIVIESIDETVSLDDVEEEFSLPTTGGYEDRVRDHIHEIVESPLLTRSELTDGAP